MLEEPRLKDAPFSDDPVKGAARGRDTWWAFGLTGGYQSFFDAATRQSLFLSVPLFGAEAELHDYFRRDWVWGFDADRTAEPGACSRCPRSRGRRTGTRW